MFKYWSLGMFIESEILFPEFVDLQTYTTTPEANVTGAFVQSVDLDQAVEIAIEPVPKQLPGSIWLGTWIEITKEEVLFHIENKGRIIVRNGQRVSVELLDGCAPNEIRPYLITCAFCALAIQRKQIPLHFSAVYSPAGAIVFAGHSGAGKSTTAAMVSRIAGWPILGDDLCVYSPPRDEGGAGLFHFGINKIKLWDDAAVRLDLPVHDLERDAFRPAKLHVTIPYTGSISANDVKLVGFLEVHSEVSVKHLADRKSTV